MSQHNKHTHAQQLAVTMGRVNVLWIILWNNKFGANQLKVNIEFIDVVCRRLKIGNGLKYIEIIYFNESFSKYVKWIRTY